MSYLYTVLLALAGAAGAYFSPETLAVVLSIGGAAAVLAARIAVHTPGKRDDGIVAGVEELLGKLAGAGASGKGSVKPAAKE